MFPKNFDAHWAGGTDPIPVVLDGGWINSLGIVRSLAELGLKSVVIHSRPDGVGLASRYAVGLTAPSPWDDPEGLISRLVAVGQRLPRPGILLITDDTYLMTLARGRERLAPYFRFTFPDAETLAFMMDKQNQYEAALRLGVPVPRSLQVCCGQTGAEWPQEAFPALVKGLSGKQFFHVFGKQTIVVKDRAALEAVLSQCAGLDALVQELIPGGDDELYTLGCYVSPDPEKEPVVFTGRKLIQIPPFSGTCSVGESLACDEIIPYGVDLLRAFHFHGIAQVEFKRDPRDGQYKLIEINGRFWKWHALGVPCGVNIAAAAYLDMAGLPPLPKVPQRNGVRWVAFSEAAVQRLMGNRDNRLRRMLPFLRPPVMHGLWSWRDPRPFFRYLQNKAQSFLRRKPHEDSHSAV